MPVPIVNRHSMNVFGIDIGGTKIAVSRLAEDHAVEEVARLACMRLPAKNARPAWARIEGKITAKRVSEAANAGDRFALDIMRESGRRLGQALALIIDVLNPEKIVIGGFYPKCRQLLEPAMQSVIKQEALASASATCKIVPAKLGDSIGSYGAICVAFEAARMEPKLHFKAKGP